MKPLTMQSTIEELYQNPLGHDILSKILLQLGLPQSILLNPLTKHLKLSMIETLTRKKLDADFWNTLLKMVNTNTDTVESRFDGVIHPQWWKEAVFYQIYPRSFYDSDNDGMGDLKGIIQKLDYLKDLGIDAIWLSPIYDSPNDDNGYDIRDYQKIQEQFGTMEDFDTLLQEVHKRNMKLIMDLVVNHTSDEHAWFQEALHNPDSKYRDYYFLVDDQGKDTPPNNWLSFFFEPAWNHYKDQHLFGLHLFSKKQMDLNWDNPNVRKDIIEMIQWWFEKGIDGFRMDVINLISKDPGLPQGNTSIGEMMEFQGIEHYYYGPHLHEYLREIQEKAFAPYHAFSVGETPGHGMKIAQLVTSESRKELDMVFNFDHLESPGKVRYDDYQYDLNYLRDYLISWQTNYGDDCWMSLFFNNHDNPRMISKIDHRNIYRQAIARLLLGIQMTSKGTPFVYQGDEMGLINYDFQSMDEITDVDAIGKYNELIKTKTPEEAFHIVKAGTREHTRVLLPWNRSCTYHQSIDTDITDDYRQLIHYRKKHPALIYGRFDVLNKSKNRYVYTRSDEKESFVIDCNLCDQVVSAYLLGGEYELVYPHGAIDRKQLPPYAIRIWKKRSED